MLSLKSSSNDWPLSLSRVISGFSITVRMIRPSSSCSSSGVCAHARHQVIEAHPQAAAAEELLDRAVVLRDLDELGVRRRVVAFGIDRQLIEIDRDRGQLALDRVRLRRLLDDVHALVAVALELVLQETRQRLRRLLDDVMLWCHPEAAEPRARNDEDADVDRRSRRAATDNVTISNRASPVRLHEPHASGKPACGRRGGDELDGGRAA